MDPLDASGEAYRRGTVAEFAKSLDAIRGSMKQITIENYFYLAVLERRADKLEYLLSNHSYGQDEERVHRSTFATFLEEADRVDPEKDPETFKVLEQSELRKKHPRQPAKEPDDWTRRTQMAVQFDVGGSCPIPW